MWNIGYLGRRDDLGMVEDEILHESTLEIEELVLLLESLFVR